MHASERSAELRPDVTGPESVLQFSLLPCIELFDVVVTSCRSHGGSDALNGTAAVTVA
jgi:hypothetical protein